MAHDPTRMPADLPVPIDDGAADGLVGSVVPEIALPSTDGGFVRLDRAERVVLYAYPRTAAPGEPAPGPEWDAIPGARGCTPEACAFRDHAAELKAAGADVLGLSAQDTAHQRELVERLHLPFPILSDEHLEFARALGLPTFEAGGLTLLRRITLVITAGVVEHCFYPVFPPDEHPREVLDWLRG